MTKPHLTYSEQVQLLVSRGMEISNFAKAEKILEHYGYYRFSGYFYPFRKMAPYGMVSNERRVDEFVPEVSIDHIVNLIEFDQTLTSILLSALGIFESSLRAQVAYILGEKSAFIHLNENLLHPKLPHTQHLNWLNLYSKDIRSAREQDFVRHHAKKYNGKFPIWVASEFMQFGTLNSLLMNISEVDFREIALKFGFESGKLFHGLLENFRRLRNDCAHHNRIWNSSFNHHLITQPSHLINKRLFHLSQVPKDKIYSRLVFLIYSLDSIYPDSGFKNQIKTHISNFPAVPIVTPEADMGFPDHWKRLDFWMQ